VTAHGRPRDNLLKRSVTARLLTPLLGALALLWRLAALTWYAAHQVHAVNAAAAANQDRVVLLSEIRSLSRSLQRDALNLITEDDASERTTILHKFTARSHAMRADLCALQRVSHHALPPGYFTLSDRVLEALRRVARQAQDGDRAGALRRFHREIWPAERAASRVADAEIESLTARTGTLRSDAEDVEVQAIQRRRGRAGSCRCANRPERRSSTAAGQGPRVEAE
jgi:hypothetical protein